MSVGYYVHLERDDGGDTLTLEPDDIRNPSFPDVATTVSEWSLEVVPPAPDLADWRFARVDSVEYEDRDGTRHTILPEGTVDTVLHRPDHTIVRGLGPGYQLKGGGTQVIYETTAYHAAIEDFFQTETSLTPTVHTPTTEQVDDDKTVFDASDEAEWADLFPDVEDDSALIGVESDELVALEATVARDGRTTDNESGTTVQQDSDYVGEGAEVLESAGAFVEYGIDPNADTPAEEVGIAVRVDYRDSGGSGDTNIEIEFNGVTLRDEDIDLGDVPSGPNWEFYGADMAGIGGVEYEAEGSDLTTGDSHTLTITTSTIGEIEPAIDYIAFYDMRAHGEGAQSWDNSVDGDHQLEDPPLVLPIETESDVHIDPWNVTDGTATLTADGTTNLDVALSNDGGDSYPIDETDSDSASGAFPEAGRSVRVRLTVGSTGASRTGSTPTENFESREVDDITVTVDTDDLPVIHEREFAGTFDDIAREMHDRPGFVAVYGWDGAGTVESFAAGERTESADWTTRQDGVEWGHRTREYANQITVLGPFDRDRQTRDVAIATADSEIQRLQDLGYSEDEATVPATIIETETEDVAELEAAAVVELQRRIQQDDLDVSLDVVPLAIRAGYAYDINEDAIPEEAVGEETLRRTEMTDSAEPTGALEFEEPERLFEVVARSDRDAKRTKRSIRYDSGEEADISLAVETSPFDPNTDFDGSDAVLEGELTELEGADSAECFFEYRDEGESGWPNATTPQTLTATGIFDEGVDVGEFDGDGECRAVAEADGVRAEGDVELIQLTPE